MLPRLILNRILTLNSAEGVDYHYDSYGNVVRNGRLTNEYDVFNKPTKLGNTQFWYGPNREKVKQQTGDKITYFVAGGAVEIEEHNGQTKTTTRVGNYVVKDVDGVVSREFHLKDHLGSTDVITDEYGQEIARMAFDPFGERLETHAGSDVLSFSAANDSSYKGYTGHDQLDHMGLVHMGGRVYDPYVGRFMSADLFVQSPYNSQSYNRYSYVFNNPLNRVDPTGYESMFMSMLSLRIADNNAARPIQTNASRARDALRYAINKGNAFQDSSGSWNIVKEGRQFVELVLKSLKDGSLNGEGLTTASLEWVTSVDTAQIENVMEKNVVLDGLLSQVGDDFFEQSSVFREINRVSKVDVSISASGNALAAMEYGIKAGQQEVVDDLSIIFAGYGGAASITRLGYLAATNSLNAWVATDILITAFNPAYFMDPVMVNQMGKENAFGKVYELVTPAFKAKRRIPGVIAPKPGPKPHIRLKVPK